MSFPVNAGGRQIPGTDASSRSGGRQIPGSDNRRRGAPARTGDRVVPNRGTSARATSRNAGRQIPGSDYRGDWWSTPSRTPSYHRPTTVHTFSVGPQGRRARKVSVGVGILAGAILLGLGILFAAPPAIAIGAIILGISMISTIITVIAERNLELTSEL